MPDLRHWSRRELARLRQDMDRVFERTCMDLGIDELLEASELAMVVLETEDTVVVEVEAPGMGAEDLSLSVTEKALVLSGCREQTLEGCTTSHRFRKEMALPHPVDVDETSAVLSGGVLQIRLPKRFKKAPRNVPILERN